MSQRMFSRKIWLEVNVLKLLVIFSGASTAIVSIIYLFTSDGSALNVFSQQMRYIHTSTSIRIDETKPLTSTQTKKPPLPEMPRQRVSVVLEKYNEGELKNRLIREKIKMLTSNNHANHDSQMEIIRSNISTKNVHIFYALPVDWLATKSNVSESDLFSNARFEHAFASRIQPKIMFYPLMGLYKSNEKIVSHHLQAIKRLGINVVIVTWSPSFQKYLLNFLLEMLQRHSLQVAIEIDDYANRSPYTIFNDLEYFFRTIWLHTAFYKVNVHTKNKQMPLFYVRNAEALSDSEWCKLLSPNGPISIRDSIKDSIFIGHIRYVMGHLVRVTAIAAISGYSHSQHQKANTTHQTIEFQRTVHKATKQWCIIHKHMEKLECLEKDGR